MILEVKFNFTEGEEITFVWRFKGKDSLTFKHGVVDEIEDSGIWFGFDDDEENVSFIPYSDMHCFYRAGSEDLEGTIAGELGKVVDLMRGGII
jgi:hypothetical protein